MCIKSKIFKKNETVIPDTNLILDVPKIKYSLSKYFHIKLSINSFDMYMDALINDS